MARGWANGTVLEASNTSSDEAREGTLWHDEEFARQQRERMVGLASRGRATDAPNVGPGPTAQRAVKLTAGVRGGLVDDGTGAACGGAHSLGSGWGHNGMKQMGLELLGT